jgi:hypothetical protein
MDVHGFTEKLEQAFYQLHYKIKIQEMQKSWPKSAHNIEHVYAHGAGRDADICK